MSAHTGMPSEGPAASDGPPRVTWRVAASVVVVLALIVLLITTLYLPTQTARSTARQVNGAVRPLPRSPILNTSTARGTVIDSIAHATLLHASPNGAVVGRMAAHTAFGSPRVVPVVRAVPGWLGVIVTELHNGRIAWISARGAQLAQLRYTIRIDTQHHRVTVFRDGRIVRSMSAAVGLPAAPTPVGRFAVTDRLYFRPQSAAYGCCALALSAHEYHLLPGWTGGDLVAMHSTPDAASIGRSLSHGCVRVSLAQGRWLVEHIPLGTLVTVRAR